MYKICTFVLLVATFVTSAFAQDAKITVQALNGKDGKPLKNQRLLVFGGETVEAAKFQHQAFDITTDDKGLADLKFDPAKTLWIQMLVDFMTICQPTLNSYSVHTITALGLSAPNNCSSFVPASTTPGLFTIFARRPTLREKMNW